MWLEDAGLVKCCGGKLEASSADCVLLEDALSEYELAELRVGFLVLPGSGAGSFCAMSVGGRGEEGREMAEKPEGACLALVGYNGSAPDGVSEGLI